MSAPCGTWGPGALPSPEPLALVVSWIWEGKSKAFWGWVAFFVLFLSAFS